MTIFKKKKKEELSFQSRPHLNNLRPIEKYLFRSDYFEIDGQVATILCFFHREGARDNFGAFWGVNRIARGLDADITTILFDQVRRKTETWVSDHQKTTENVTNSNDKEQQKAGSAGSRQKNQKAKDDLEVIAQELQNGAAYLHVHMRLMVKAPNLERLDYAVDKIRRQYLDVFKSVTLDTYHGEMKQELAGLHIKNEKKRGRGFYFTSTEYAGAHCLVTNGLSDPKGEFVGVMTGDVNNSAVLFDVDGYHKHIVVANNGYHHQMNRTYLSDIWGSKIGQSALLNNKRAVHIVLDGLDLNTVGPTLESLTARIDLQAGDVNMFEMFGDVKDELSIFATQIEKIKIMAEQAFEPTENDRSIIRGQLEDVLTKFYISQRMWYHNAKENRNKLRVVGIPHESVPTLAMFTTYLDMEYKAMVTRAARDDEALHAISVLRSVFKGMLTNNGDLFDRITTDAIDNVSHSRRCVYDLSSLLRRGEGVAMAQLVNIIGYAVQTLGEGDTVIIHGTERIDSQQVKDYMTKQFEHLYVKGGRVVFLYNSVEKMIEDKTFSAFDKADYTILGSMSQTTLQDYQKALGEVVPPDLAKHLTQRGSNLCYIRRGYNNVIFRQDLSLGFGVNIDQQVKRRRRRGGGV